MLRAILNKSWLATPHEATNCTSYLHPITKTIQVRRTRHAGHCWRSRDELIRDVLLWIPHTWPPKSRTTSTNVHSAALWGLQVVVLDRPNLGCMNDREEWLDEGQGYPCYQRDMMMMLMTLFIYIYIYIIYIIIYRQTVSLSHNSLVWLDTKDAWSWD